jgi:RNA-directed DNA polymerase
MSGRKILSMIATRSCQRHGLTWRKLMRIAERWLPSPKLRHPYPEWRFDVMTRGGSPVR